MMYVGMDVHKKTTTYCMVNDEGEVTRRGKVDSTEVGWLSIVEDHPGIELNFALETGVMTWWVVDVLRSQDIEPIVVDARQFKLIAASRKKSDRRDAHTLADSLRGGLAERCKVFVPSNRARRGRALLRARQTIVKQSTMSRNAAKGMLRSIGVNITSRQWVSENKWQSIAYSKPVPTWMTALLETHRSVWYESQKQRKFLDESIEQELMDWPDAHHLLEMPGFGSQVVLAVASSIDDPHRFHRPRQVGSYGGLAPSVRDSGEKIRHGGITKQGSSVLRFYMVQAALSAMRSKALSPGLRKWVLRLRVRRGHQVAIVALARRLLELSFRLLRDGEVYDPQFGAAMS